MTALAELTAGFTRTNFYLRDNRSTSNARMIGNTAKMTALHYSLRRKRNLFLQFYPCEVLEHRKRTAQAGRHCRADGRTTLNIPEDC